MARSRAAELDLPTTDRPTAALLTILARTTGAGNVVEIGSGAGVSGLALLQGMRDGGVLTSIDFEGSHHSVAKQSFGYAGFEPNRARLIAGDPHEVLPRLADGAYDLVVVNEPGSASSRYLAEAARLLRTDGIFVAAGIDSSAHASAAAATLAQQIRAEDSAFHAVLLPISEGLIVAVRRAEAA